VIGVKLDDAASWWWHLGLHSNDMIQDVHFSKKLVTIYFFL